MRTSLRVLSALASRQPGDQPRRPRAARTAWCSAWCSSPRRASTRPPASAAAIGEVVHYNVLEGLTKIDMDGRSRRCWPRAGASTPTASVYTFKLRKGVKFHDGEAFDASDVKFSFERAKAEGSTNKAKKAVFDNISRIDTPDPYTVILVLEQRRRQLPVPHGREHRGDPRSEERGDARRPSRSAPARSSSRTGRRARRSRW